MKTVLVCAMLSVAALLLAVQTRAGEYERHYSSATCDSDHGCSALMRVVCPSTGRSGIADTCDGNAHLCFWGHTP